MKTIKIKPLTTALIEDTPTTVFARSHEEEVRLKQRVVNLGRLAKEARRAAKVAANQGDNALADQLTDRAEELDDLIRNINIDNIDDDDITGDSDSSDRGDKKKDDDGSSDKDGQNKPGKQGDDDADGQAKGGKDKSGKDGGNDQGNGSAADQDDKDGQDSQGKASKGQKSQASNDGDENGSGRDGDDDFSIDYGDGTESSGGGDGSDSDQDSDADSDADGSDGQSDRAKKSQSSGKSSGQSSGSDDDGDDGDDGDDQDDSDDNDSDDDGSDSDSQNNQNQDNKNNKDQKDGKGGSGSPKKDIFADEEDIPQEPKIGKNGQLQQQQPEDPTIDDIIKQLQGLSGEAKRGAVDGLKDLLAGKKNESLNETLLTEANKPLRDMSEDEYGDLVNSTLDMIEKIKKVNKINDLSQRKARISSWKNSGFAKRELERELTEPKDAEERKVIAKDEAEKYRQYMSLQEFQISFSEAIKNQVEMVKKEYQSYDEINPEYEDEDIIMKADVERYEWDEVIPKIDVYFDQSSSWNHSQVEIGKRLIAKVQKEYVDQGLCKMNIYYFDDDVTQSEYASWLGRGTTYGWLPILNNIEATKADNVVIMTDHDFDHRGMRGSDNPKTVTVKGCVWWIWKDNSASPKATERLQGRSGNYQASFVSWDKDSYKLEDD